MKQSLVNQKCLLTVKDRFFWSETVGWLVSCCVMLCQVWHRGTTSGLSSWAYFHGIWILQAVNATFYFPNFILQLAIWHGRISWSFWRDRYLTFLDNRLLQELLSSYCLTEPNSGSDAASLQVYAYVISVLLVFTYSSNINWDLLRISYHAVFWHLVISASSLMLILPILPFEQTTAKREEGSTDYVLNGEKVSLFNLVYFLLSHVVVLV